VSAPKFAVRRPIATGMFILAAALFGLISLFQIPVELLPDLSYPTLTIQTVYPDAAPISVEQFVTKPIEEAVGVIPGVRDLRSTSRAGLSEVILEFEWDQKMDVTALDVREKLGLVDLPREAEVPRVLRFDPSLDPVIRIAFSGERPLDELRQLAERWIKPRLEAVRGVAAAKVRGGLEPEIVVEADEDQLAALGLTLDDLSRALQAANVNLPGGSIKDWGSVYLVRTLHEFEDLDQIRRTVVRESPNGRIRVDDVASVSRGHKDRQEIGHSQGREIVELALHREGSANTVQVAEAVREALAALNKEMPADLSLAILTDQSRYIAESIGLVWSAALLGGLLAVFVLYFFLKDLWPTFIIALSIPISVIVTFLPMRLAGVTLNIMSLGGLALGVGMLVDNSVVVLEAIDRRRQLGLSRRDAAVQGADEVAAAVTASTLTTVAVFFPIVFVKGVAGQLFYDLSITICISLVASLLVALTLIPALAALDPEAVSRRTRDAFSARSDAAGKEGGKYAWLALRLVDLLRGPLRKYRRPWGALRAALLLPVHVALLPLYLTLILLELIAKALHPVVIRISRISIGGLEIPPVGDGLGFGSVFLTVFLYPLRLALLLVLLAVWAVLWAFTWTAHVLTWPLARLWNTAERRYPGTLAAALRRRWVVLPAALVLFGLSLAALPTLGKNLVPDLSQGEFAFRLRLPEGTPLETTAQVVDRIEAPLLAGRDGTRAGRFERIFSVIGSLPSSASGRQTLGENLAQINFVLPEGSRAADEAAAVDRVRQVLSLFPTAEAEMARPSVLSMSAPVSVKIFSEDLDQLDRAAARVEKALAHVSGVEDIATTSEPGSPEIEVELDRERAGMLGLQAEELGRSLRRQIRGELVGKFREAEQRLDIRLRSSERDRKRASQVASLRIRLANGTSVPVSGIARIKEERGPGAIHRSGGARYAEVTAKTSAEDLGQTIGDVKRVLAGVDLPPGVVAEMAGQDKELQVSFRSLWLAMGLALFLVYVVMAAQFESFLHPFVIILTVPLGTVGVVAGLAATATPVSVLVLIGSVMLAGIVVNNAIVLVDAVNRLRREGKGLDEALLAGGRERLRPILMTTGTTVLGLLPMALGLGAGDELRRPLAVTVIAGLSAATVLTLIIIPCVYRTIARAPKENAAPDFVPAGAPDPGPPPREGA
jgi:HAE1 family hydrophobic/amphiphilic exporter-1